MAQNTQIIKIGEHSYMLPERPKTKEEVLFCDDDYEHAFWRRIPLSDLFLKYLPSETEINSESGTVIDSATGFYKSLSISDTVLFRTEYKREVKRRNEGVWFRNGDELTYITGHHYFMLQYCKIYGYPKTWGRYFEFQRDIFYLIDLAEKDPERLGVYFTKAKKIGITACLACMFLNIATTKEENILGIMSKKTDDAVATNMMYLFHSWDGLPMVFKPTAMEARKAGRIEFGVGGYRGKNIKGIIKQNRDSENSLNSKVFCAATKPAGFDAPVMKAAWIDEPTKVLKDSNADFDAIFTATAAALKFQNTINGKMYLTNYVSEENDECVNANRRIYFDSKLKSIESGERRTKSELICHHISALYSYIEFIDDYGHCNEIRANKEIEKALNSVKKDGKALLGKTRQLARTEDEAWTIGSEKSVFNPINISNSMTNLQREISESPYQLYEVGYLVWDNPLWETGLRNKRQLKEFCPVKFIPLNTDDIMNGKIPKLKLFKRLKPEFTNIPLTLGRDKWSNLNAPKKFKMFGGIDPVNYAKESELENPSKVASYTMNIHSDEDNAMYPFDLRTKILVSEYIERPESPAEWYDDIVKEVIYFGKLVLVEGNASYMGTRMIEDGLQNYMMVRESENGTICQCKPYWKVGVDYNLIRISASATNNELLNSIIMFITDYISVIEGESNYLAKIKSMKLLDQMLVFNDKDTKKYDAVMAFGYTLICYYTYMASLNRAASKYQNASFMADVLTAFRKS